MTSHVSGSAALAFRIVDPMKGVGPTPFDDHSWRAGFLDWIATQLRARSGVAVEPVEVRIRPWSIVVGIPLADGGRLWAKANSPGMAFEAALSERLGDWAPELVLTPLAIEAAEGWLLLPHGGDVLPWPDPDEPAGITLRDPLRDYARLQRILALHVDEMLALGVPDFRPRALPDVVDRLLERAPVPEVADHRSQIREWCAELDASDVSASLDHSDLHYEQVFVDPVAGTRFFDWGMATIAHPFASLLGPRSHYLADPATQAALSDAYLGEWPGDRSELRRTGDLAARLGLIAWAAVRDRNYPGATPSDAVEEHIRKLLNWLITWTPLPPT